MKTFGNWIVTNELIEWDSSSKHGHYQIAQSRLLELTDRSGTSMYDWLIHVPPKTWLDKQDVLDLNDAFNHLAEISNLTIDSKILKDTLAHQANILLTK